MDLNQALEDFNKKWAVEVQTITGETYKGQIKWWDNYNICLKFKDGSEMVFFKANLVYLRLQ